MIQLSAFLVPGAENPRKTADFAALEGNFEQLLSGEGTEGALPGGNALPEGGKILPDGLPTIELPRLAGRKLVARLDPATAEPALDQAIPEPAPKAADAAVAPDAETTGDVDAETPAGVASEALAENAVAVLAQQPAASAPADPAIDIEVDTDTLATPRRNPAFRRAAIAAKAAPERAAPHADVAAGQPPVQQAMAKAAIAAARLPAAPVLDPNVATKGERPADAPQPARIAPAAHGDPVLGIKLNISADAQSDSAPGERRAAPPAGPAQAAAPVAGEQATTFAAAPEPAAVQPAAPAPREAALPGLPAAAHAVRPQDLTTLVDRLVEARENARSTNANLTVMHAEFGRVSMHFAQDSGNLTVSLANSDPGFARAVTAAVAPDTGMNAEAQPQGDRRGEGGNGFGARTAQSDHGAAGEHGHRPRAGHHDRGGAAANPSHREARGARAGHRGIFA